MRLRMPRRTHVGEDGVIPLINVVFLLLVFFMVAGRISASDPFAVTPPRSAGERPAGPEALTVLVGAEGRLALDGRVVEKTAFESLAAEHVGAAPDLAVRLKADGGAEARDVVAVMEMLRKAGARKLVLFTMRDGRDP